MLGWQAFTDSRSQQLGKPLGRTLLSSVYFVDVFLKNAACGVETAGACSITPS